MAEAVNITRRTILKSETVGAAMMVPAADLAVAATKVSDPLLSAVIGYLNGGAA